MLAGAVAGAAAFVTGYVLLYLMRGSEWKTSFENEFERRLQLGGASLSQLKEVGLTLPDQWQVVGIAYHGLHQVDLSTTVTQTGEPARSMTRISIYYAGETLPTLIPIVVLFSAGFGLAAQRNCTDIGSGAITGATVVTGYLPLILATSFLFNWTSSFSNRGISVTFSISPELASSFIFAGICYPIIIGGVGGAVASQLTSGSPAGQSEKRNPPHETNTR
jgi:hypothetical protein